ncbi:hypothetical protein BCF59_0711 [Mycoplasmopsis mustelae]|uniref:Lipoprotein n=1 Tax=Mycoplasmopsis mustelae TaxID=171289 RepID=A0A4R7UE41_9BACT|nr:hypothetical protein [Mycoplasmopsis mustelae]TDV22862.1 hypothetical protein BCF59_0711 [Mycoplasmopsis mustelae]
MKLKKIILGSFSVLTSIPMLAIAVACGTESKKETPNDGQGQQSGGSQQTPGTGSGTTSTETQGEKSAEQQSLRTETQKTQNADEGGSQQNKTNTQSSTLNITNTKKIVTKEEYLQKIKSATTHLVNNISKLTGTSIPEEQKAAINEYLENNIKFINSFIKDIPDNFDYSPYIKLLDKMENARSLSDIQNILQDLPKLLNIQHFNSENTK